MESYVEYLKKDKIHHLGLQTKEFESIREKMAIASQMEVAALQKNISVSYNGRLGVDLVEDFHFGGVPSDQVV